jgi:hypothetical protein
MSRSGVINASMPALWPFGDSPALDHNDFLNRRRFLECDVGVSLQRHYLAAAIAAVGSDEDLALRVVDPVTKRLR